MVATAAGAAPTLSQTRVRGLDIFGLPRAGLPTSVWPDCAWDFGQAYDRIASGSTQFLSRDPLVATTRSAYGYVGGNPLNGADPSGLIEQGRLSQEQRDKVHSECAGWQNSSLCEQAAFCDSAEQCQEIGQIAVDDFNVVESGLAHCTSAGVPLEGGYMATYSEAQRDVGEIRAAFHVANMSLDFYNEEQTMRSEVAKACFAATFPAIIAGPWGAASGCIGAAAFTATAVDVNDGPISNKAGWLGSLFRWLEKR